MSFHWNEDQLEVSADRLFVEIRKEKFVAWKVLTFQRWRRSSLHKQIKVSPDAGAETHGFEFQLFCRKMQKISRQVLYLWYFRESIWVKRKQNNKIRLTISFAWRKLQEKRTKLNKILIKLENRMRLQLYENLCSINIEDLLNVKVLCSYQQACVFVLRTGDVWLFIFCHLKLLLTRESWQDPLPHPPVVLPFALEIMSSCTQSLPGLKCFSNSGWPQASTGALFTDSGHS